MTNDPSHHHENDAPVLSPVDARQGRRGMPVVFVLVGGLVLAAIVWGGVEMWGEHIDPDKAQTSAPGPGPATNPAGSAQPTCDNSSSADTSTQTAPTDKSENYQRGINTTPQKPSRNGVQNSLGG